MSEHRPHGDAALDALDDLYDRQADRRLRFTMRHGTPVTRSGRPGEIWSRDEDRPDDEWRQVRLEAEGAGRPAPGRTAGERFAASESYRAWRGDGSAIGARGVTVPLVADDGMAAWLANLDSDADLIWPTETLFPSSTATLTAPLARLVNVVPSSLEAVLVDVTPAAIPTGAGVPAPAVSPAVTLTASRLPEQLFRWAVHSVVAKSLLLDDSRVAGRIIDAVARRVWARTLDVEIASGDGSDVAGTRRQLDGILNTTGVTEVPVSTGTRVTALLTALEALAANGYPGPHDVVGAPAAVRALVEEAEWRRDRFVTLRSVAPVDHLPAGSLLAGQWSEAALFQHGPLAVDIRGDHADLLTEGLVALQPSAFLHFRAVGAAFAEVTGA